MEEGFGYTKTGGRYSTCRRCRARRPEESRAYYIQNKEALAAHHKSYKEAHREELSAKAREKVACELCGRVVCWDKMKHHQSTRLCEKHRPAP